MDYTVREVAALLKLSEAEVRRCIKEGVLTPTDCEDGEVRLKFQDLVLLRSVANLTASRIPAVQVRRALKRLKSKLPPETPLSSVQIAAGGSQVVVREGQHAWDVESRQLLLDLAGKEAPAHAAAGPQPVRISVGAPDAYDRGCALEESDPVAARQAYREALAKDPSHVGARVNLGRLLHAAGDLGGAETHFRRASELRPDDPMLVFNLGVALEDRGKIEAAISAYARALFLDPKYADAHFNLARLHERRGDRLAALRHLNAYRNCRAR